MKRDDNLDPLRAFVLTAIIFTLAFALISCAHTPPPPCPIPEPVIEIVRVEVPIHDGCHLDLLPPEMPAPSNDDTQWLSDWILELEDWVDAVLAAVESD